jgi:hypothetical protein
MNWDLYYKEIKLWPCVIVIMIGWILGVIIHIALGTDPVKGFLVFWALAIIEYGKAIYLLTQLALKRITMNFFFWCDNLIALCIAIGGWFWFRIFFTHWLWPLIIYLFGWLIIAGLVNMLFKREDSYESFDVWYGAPKWMMEWKDSIKRTNR